MSQSGQEQSIESTTEVAMHQVSTLHSKHCFVVMPSGREPDDQRWFKGWYEVVIKPAVQEAGYESILAAAEEQPGAINDEIRTHLALDPMVVADLGGSEPEDEPNPNVMYELGIRHALGLPLVMMAWKGQRLPFDVGNQRVIMEERDLLDIELNKKRLVSFIRAAEQGRYYRPMEAVERLATIEEASTALTEDSLLRALAQEVRDLRATVAASVEHRQVRSWRERKETIKRIIRSTQFRKELYPHFLSSGGNPSAWARVLQFQPTAEQMKEMSSWDVDQWKTYVAARAQEYAVGLPIVTALPLGVVGEGREITVDETLLEAVRQILPAQPWPHGTHREVAEKLDISNKAASRCIAILVERGVFMKQVDGQLAPDEEDR